MKPSMISLSVKFFFSARWGVATAAWSAAAAGGSTGEIVNATSAAAMKKGLAKKLCRRGLFIVLTLKQSEGAGKPRAPRRQQVPWSAELPYDHGGADPDAAVEIGDVLVGHAEAAGRHRLADRLRLVGA